MRNNMYIWFGIVLLSAHMYAMQEEDDWHQPESPTQLFGAIAHSKKASGWVNWNHQQKTDPDHPEWDILEEGPVSEPTTPPSQQQRFMPASPTASVAASLVALVDGQGALHARTSPHTPPAHTSASAASSDVSLDAASSASASTSSAVKSTSASSALSHSVAASAPYLQGSWHSHRKRVSRRAKNEPKSLTAALSPEPSSQPTHHHVSQYIRRSDSDPLLAKPMQRLEHVTSGTPTRKMFESDPFAEMTFGGFIWYLLFEAPESQDH